MCIGSIGPIFVLSTPLILNQFFSIISLLYILYCWTVQGNILGWASEISKGTYTIENIGSYNTYRRIFQESFWFYRGRYFQSVNMAN